MDGYNHAYLNTERDKIRQTEGGVGNIGRKRDR